MACPIRKSGPESCRIGLTKGTRSRLQIGQNRPATASPGEGTGFASAEGVAEANNPLTASDSTKCPVRDEWGIYDPQRAGLAAVFRQLSPGDAPEPQHHLKARPAPDNASNPVNPSK